MDKVGEIVSVPKHLLSWVTIMKADEIGEPAGCPGCNPAQVLPWLDAHKLVALDVKPDSPGSIACEQCGKSWWVVSLETAESP